MPQPPTPTGPDLAACLREIAIRTDAAARHPSRLSADVARHWAQQLDHHDQQQVSITNDGTDQAIAELRDKRHTWRLTFIWQDRRWTLRHIESDDTDD